MTTKPGSTAGASWGVVATARETPEVLAAFVTHHLAAGAARIYLYLDDPQPRAVSMLSGLPGVTVLRCDADHWARLGKAQRPASQEARQTANAVDAYARAGVDWLAHIDADEFIMPHRDLGRELAMVPEIIDCVALPMRERVFRQEAPADSIFDGLCRVPFERSRRAALALFGQAADYTMNGLVGHVAGKCLVRTGSDALLMGIHTPRPRPDRRRRARLIKLASTAAVLLHLDGFTRAHWVAKMLRYAADSRYTSIRSPLAPHQFRQIEHIQQARSPLRAANRLHDMLKSVDAETEARMRALGVIEDMPVDPAAGLARYAMADWIDLSPQLCDAQTAALTAAAGTRPALPAQQAQQADGLRRAG